MLKKIFLFIMILLIASYVFSQDLKILEEIYSPNKIEIFNNKLYVAQRTSFYIYQLDDLSFIKKFGRTGEGPGELTPSSVIFNDIFNVKKQIFVQGEKKALYFSEDGGYIKEVKKRSKFFKMVPFGENFVVQHLSEKGKGVDREYLSIKLIDKNSNLVKVLYKQKKHLLGGAKSGIKSLPMFPDKPKFSVYKDQLYLHASDNGTTFEIFNLKGEKIGSISCDIKPIAISTDNKKRTLDVIKNDRTIRSKVKSVGGWKNFTKKYNFIFPKFYPIISDFVINQDKIYIQTYLLKDQKAQYIVMNMDGKIVKKIFLPTMADIPFTAILVGQNVRLYKFYKNNFYFLKDTDGDESWEFHKINI